MSTWSRPYVRVKDADGNPVAWDAPGRGALLSPATLGLPPTGTLELRWRTPLHANPRKRRLDLADPATAALLLDLLAVHAAGGAGYTAASDGLPLRTHESGAPAADLATPASPVPGAPLVPALAEPLTALAPVLGERVIVSPQNRTLREVGDGVIGLGATIAEIVATLRAQRGWIGAHDTNMSNVLDFVAQVLVYAPPILDDDEDEDDNLDIAEWKSARLALPGVQLGASIHVKLLLAPDLELAVRERRRTDRRIDRLNEQARTRFYEAWDRYEAAQAARAAGTRGGGRMPNKPDHTVMWRQPPEQCSARTEELFATGLGMVLNYAEHAGLLVGPNPWRAFSSVGPTKTGYRRSSALRPHQRNVPSIGQVVDIADAIAQLGPVDPRTGRPTGERFRALILTSPTGARDSEIDALQVPDFRPGARPQLVFSRNLTLTHSAAPRREGASDLAALSTVHLSDRLKDRPPGEVRIVDLSTFQADAIATHIEAGYASEDSLFTGPEGGFIRWGNLVDVYWYPAVAKVLGHSSQTVLRELRRSWLRKAAVTWMLRAGQRPDQVAAITGHKPEVMYRHYVGVVGDTASHHPWQGWDAAWDWAVQEHDVP
jgi:integrase